METFRDQRNREFSAHLNRLLNRAGLTPSDVCRKVWGEHVNAKGYTEAKGLQAFSTYLRGHSYPNEPNRRKIAAALGISVEELENPKSDATPTLAPAKPRAVPEKPVAEPPLPDVPRDPPGTRPYEHMTVTPEPGRPGMHRVRLESVVTGEALATLMLAWADMEKVSKQTGGGGFDA